MTPKENLLRFVKITMKTAKSLETFSGRVKLNSFKLYCLGSA